MNLRRFLISIACLFQLAALLDAADVYCDYKTEEWLSVGWNYLCYTDNYPFITDRQSAIIDSLNGINELGKDESDVTGFVALRKRIHFFPRNLENIFKNLKIISIHSSGLKEILQSDLKPFPMLEFIILSDNNIEVLEKGLFDYNPQLRFISMDSNKIVHIDENVFNNLHNLAYLRLEMNSCIDKHVENNTAQIKEFISEINTKCQNQDFLTIENNLKELEENLTCTKSEAIPIFIMKLDQVESQIEKKSEFSSFFTKQIADMSEWKSQSTWTLENKICLAGKSVKKSKFEIMKEINGIVSGVRNDMERSLDATRTDLTMNIETLNSTLEEHMTSVNMKILNHDESIVAKISKLEQTMSSKLSNLEQTIQDFEERMEKLIEQELENI